MDCCINETSEHKEEEQHTNASTTTVKGTLKFKTIGEGHQEDKEEVDDHNIIPPMLQHP